jgi:hypothetical protein
MRLLDRDRRYWILFALLLLLGVISMLCAGQIAVRALPNWSVNADIGSNIDPNQRYLSQKGTVVFEPILAAILTPPAWKYTFLTPEPGTSNLATVIVGIFNPEATPEIKPTEVATQFTVIPTGTPVSSPTAVATNTLVVIPPLPTRTPTRVVIVNTPTYTITPTSTSTLTMTSTSTYTETPTATPTSTSTSTVTSTVTSTSTSTNTPSLTFTPSQTFITTSTLTLTPTSYSAPGCSGSVNLGSGDGGCYTLPTGNTLDLTVAFTVDGNTADDEIIYYEKPADVPYTVVYMDMVIIYVHVVENNTWYPVFYWGGNIPGEKSSLDGYSPESDNQTILRGAFYGSPIQTGVRIDVDSPLIAAGVTFPATIDSIRIEAPSGDSGDGCDVDAVEIWP